MTERLPFHQQLSYERKLRGSSQEDVASKVGCGPKTVLRWENGKSLPQPYYRPKLCELFSKNAEELGLLEEQADNIETTSPLIHTSYEPQSSPIQSPAQETSSPAEAENHSSQQSVVYDI